LPNVDGVRVCLRALILSGRLPNVEFDFEHAESEKARVGQGSGGNQPKPAKQASKTAYDILGVYPGTSLGEITRAYHQMAQMYHPDKVAGLGPELREVAERRMKEINRAYEELKPRPSET
jgi:DnaJ-class molecular chaperone